MDYLKGFINDQMPGIIAGWISVGVPALIFNGFKRAKKRQEAKPLILRIAKRQKLMKLTLFRLGCIREYILWIRLKKYGYEYLLGDDEEFIRNRISKGKMKSKNFAEKFIRYQHEYGDYHGLINEQERYLEELELQEGNIKPPPPDWWDR